MKTAARFLFWGEELASITPVRKTASSRNLASRNPFLQATKRAACGRDVSFSPGTGF